MVIVATNEYTTYNIGATYTTHGFAVDLGYVGNSVLLWPGD